MRTQAIIYTTILLATGAVRADSYSADNWFEMRINGEMVAHDSVPIMTERSFNAESFTFEADPPFVVGLVAKDFRENDTGLEYIGTSRQQMGDGGVILQIRDAAGATVAVSDGDWQCLVVHVAPLDKSCEGEADPAAGVGTCGYDITEPPEGWDMAGFDASDWPAARVYSEAEVRPKDGYDRISWDGTAKLIWGPDLEQDNTVLCRMVIE